MNKRFVMYYDLYNIILETYVCDNDYDILR